MTEVYMTHFLLPDLSSSLPHKWDEKALLCVRDDVLVRDRVDELIQFAIDQQPRFVPTSITTNSERYPDHRNSLVLYDVPTWMQDLVTSLAPEALNELGHPTFFISRLEAQLTAHNDNNYYKIHSDNGCSRTNNRKLTFVYYFYREPKVFTGGDLVVYDTRIEEGRLVNVGLSQVYEPKNNSIVFFLSSYLHEVKPVKCPTLLFENSRFTVNGWIS